MNRALHTLIPGLVILALALTTILAAGCSQEEPPAEVATTPPPVERPPNFVLVVADTLRADRVDGPDRRPDITPNLDAMRKSGSYFSNAVATSSWTLPSTVSLFVSQLPSRHGVSMWGSRLGDELILLPEILNDAGYRTGGWSANRLITRERGFRRGFDEFEMVYHPEWKGGMPPDSPYAFAHGADLAAKAVAWLDESSDAADPKPFFLYLHFMEPHTPFMCPPSAGPECKKAARSLNRSLLASVWMFSPEQQAMIRSFYDSDVSALDRVLGQLRAALAERGLLDNTWILFTADHGEMLGEHGLYLHGRALFEETVHIPLLILPPGGKERVVTTPVSIIDLAPTILAAAGVPQPAEFDGRSLLPAVQGAMFRPRPVAMELLAVNDERDARQRHIVAVRNRDSKFLLGMNDEVQLFDLKADPKEIIARPAQMQDLELLLKEAGSRYGIDAVDTKAAPELTPEMEEHLKGLGYLRE